MMKLNLSKAKHLLYEEVVWTLLLDAIPEDNILIFDLEVSPPVTKEISRSHQIIAAGIWFKGEISIFIGNEREILTKLNNFLNNKKILLTVGYGSLYLDIPLLLNKLRVYPYLNMLRRVFNKAPHLDLAYFASSYLYLSGYIDRLTVLPLSKIASLLNIGHKEFSPVVYDDPIALKQYLYNDITLIKKVFDLLRENYFNSLL